MAYAIVLLVFLRLCLFGKIAVHKDRNFRTILLDACNRQVLCSDHEIYVDQ